MKSLYIAVVAATVMTFLTSHARALESNRTERSSRGVTNAHGWHYDFQNNINGIRGAVANYPVASDFYFDPGLIPFAVNLPRKTYLPPSDWPDYTGGYPYPPAGRPTIAPPAPVSTTGHAPSYLPPPISTTTEFTLPEVIDAKKPTIFTANSGALDSKRTFDNTNRNRWDIAATVYRDGHSSEPIKIMEMKCDKEGRFRAILHGQQLEISRLVPVFEDVREQTTTRECIVFREGAKMQLDISYTSYASCGVTDCSDAGRTDFLCVRLRFPTMNGLRLSDDFILTLRCRIQEPIVIHTKRLEVPVSRSVSARSAGATAVGGASNAVRCQLEVYRRGSTDTDQFSSRLEPGAVVVLGEELMVRIIVADGDGWQWSRLGEVVLEGGAGAGAGAGVEARVVLVTPDGCVVPEASAICPQQPRRESDLAHVLLIRAPMFEGTTSGSTVHLSVRVLACRRAYDCVSQCSRQKRFLPNPHAKENITESTGIIVDKYSVTLDRDANEEGDMRFSNEVNHGTIDEKGFDKFRKMNSRRAVESLSTYRATQTDSTKIRRKRDHVSGSMTADSLANVAFTVVRVNKAESNVKSKGGNDKAIAMVIVLSGVVSLLMLAVILVHIYRKRAEKNDLL